MLASRFNIIAWSIELPRETHELIYFDISRRIIILGWKNDGIFAGGQCGGRVDLAEVHEHHHGRLASFEHRMAAWRAPLRGVNSTAPHPAINKLAEREQPRDEPFNSATFCLPSPSTSVHPLSRSCFPRFCLLCRIARCSSSVTLAISDSARALPFRSATR